MDEQDTLKRINDHLPKFLEMLGGSDTSVGKLLRHPG